MQNYIYVLKCGKKYYLKESIIYKSHYNENVFKRRTKKIINEVIDRVNNRALSENKVLTHKKLDALLFSLEEANNEIDTFNRYKNMIPDSNIIIDIEEKV